MADDPVGGDGVTLVPVPSGAGLDDVDRLTGGRSPGAGWPHADTAVALTFTAAGGETWLVVDADGHVVGECGTKAPPLDGTVEIGYGLAAASRGRGLGARAVQTLLAELSRRPDVRSVVANVAVDNLASRRLLERQGFQVIRMSGGEVGYALHLARPRQVR
ncbi:MAG TPA: GNAT family N-acetyltransferase [Mycobacteriales bacterium]|nr:GNAT family N-acetyltransferase [Mycobacteriales bacterium]